MVSGSADGSIRVWNFSTCELLQSLPTVSEESISSISIGTNAKLIITNEQR